MIAKGVYETSVVVYSDSGNEAPAPVAMAEGAFYTLRQLDERHDRPKGTAFRAFKRLRPGLAEGADFLRLDASEEGAQIEVLRAEGVIYPASVHVVLIAAERAAEIGAAMESVQ